MNSHVDTPVVKEKDSKEKDVNIPLESKKLNSHVDIPLVKKKILKKKISTHL